jgi:hypothetical protein
MEVRLPKALQGMNFFDEGGGEDTPKKKEEKPKNDEKSFRRMELPKRGQKISMEKAMEIANVNGYSGGELYKFLEEYSPQTIQILTTEPEKWKGFRKDPNYEPPSTKEEIEAYNKFNERYEKIKNSSNTPELIKYLDANQFKVYTKSNPNNKLRGNFIVDSAKKKGAKVEQNEDGTFTVYDDETVFKDTDKTFGKGRIIDPDAYYGRTTYKRGTDLVNAYEFIEPPKYSGKMPKPEEIEALSQGEYRERALDPQYKPYYANVYFNPQNTAEPLTYGSQTNAQDLERFKTAQQLRESIMPIYERKQKMKRIKKDVKDAIRSIVPEGGGSGSDDGLSSPGSSKGM